MKTLPPALESKLESEQYPQALFIDMTIFGNSFYYTTWDTKIYDVTNSVMYTPRAMNFHGVSLGSENIVDSMNVDFDDVDRALYTSLAQTSNERSPIKVTYAVLKDTAVKDKILSSVVIFDGTVDEWSYEPGVIKITAASVFVQWSRITTSQYSTSCRWKKFKGAECKYSGGGATCDRTHAQCVAYGNELNYGGFPYVPSLLNKKISI